MNAPRLIARMRQEAGFMMLPLLNSTGDAAGLHFHRFLGGYVHVVQAWEDNYAVAAYLPDAPDTAAPFACVPPTYLHIGTFAEVASGLLHPGPRHRLAPDPDENNGGERSA